MNIVRCFCSVIFIFSFASSAAADDVILIDHVRDQFHVRVYLPNVPSSKNTKCATYYKGRLLHQGLARQQEYNHSLQMHFINEPVFVQCSHPDYEGASGELGIAYSHQGQIKRTLHLGFDRPRTAQRVQPVYDQQKRIVGISYDVEIPQPYLEEHSIAGLGSFQKIRFKGFDIPYLKGEEFEMMPEVPVLSPLVVLP